MIVSAELLELDRGYKIFFPSIISKPPMENIREIPDFPWYLLKRQEITPPFPGKCHAKRDDGRAAHTDRHYIHTIAQSIRIDRHIWRALLTNFP
jgi:hypothetical protein